MFHTSFMLYFQNFSQVVFFFPQTFVVLSTFLIFLLPYLLFFFLEYKYYLIYVSYILDGKKKKNKRNVKFRTHLKYFQTMYVVLSNCNYKKRMSLWCTYHSSFYNYDASSIALNWQTFLYNLFCMSFLTLIKFFFFFFLYFMALWMITLPCDEDVTNLST